MKSHIHLVVITVLFFFTGAVKAHVSLVNSLDSAILKMGQFMTISWEEEIPHNTYDWDLFFSHDNGMTWETIRENIPVDIRNYEWAVPFIQTEGGRIKIVQDNEYEDYEDISGLFTIGEITTSVYLVSENDSSPVSSLINFPNPFYDWINVEFNIAKTAHVNISIYNREFHK